jgi:hypothetical protein
VWISSDERIATVTAGRVTGQVLGSVIISAYLGPLSATASVDVAGAPALLSLAIVPAAAVVPQGSSMRLQAIGTFFGGSTAAVAPSWTVDDPTLATIDDNGLLSAVEGTGPSPQVVDVRASVDGQSADATITILPNDLVGLTIEPATASLAVGATRSFTATGTFAGGSSYDITGVALWSVDPPGRTIVVTSGVVTADDAGTSTVTVSYGSLSASATITAFTPVLTTIEVMPDGFNGPIIVGQSVQPTATGIYSDGTTLDISGQVTWTSTPPGSWCFTLSWARYRYSGPRPASPPSPPRSGA